jgi:hypothetical protein
MKKHEKLATGIALGAIVALFLIPKTRKMMSQAIGNVSGSLKNLLHKAENIAVNS